MEQNTIPFYLGIDINDRYAMVSYYQPNKEEPETVSTIAGSEMYQIPLVIAKRRGIGQWYYGDEARKMAKTCEMICVDALLHRALAGESIRIEEESYLAEDLLGLFMQKLIALPQKLGNAEKCDRLVITTERLSKDNMELFWKIAQKAGFSKAQFSVLDHKESFYYFALSQQKDLWLHDVYLFEYEQDAIHYFGLKKDMKTTPKLVTITESSRVMVDGDKDSTFLHIQQKAFENQIVSSVYLVGDGFDGEWMKASLTFLCRGRRAFVGKNLFSKGACYAALAYDHEAEWPFLYMGENEMKFNISLKVRTSNSVEFYSLISAGKNWFDTSGQCEVILDKSPEIDFWKQLPHSREAKIETLELTDLPNRPNKTTRLRITAKAVADDKVAIEIKDLGFGELFRSTDKIWKYTMSM